jgi:transcriptional regulator with XRE-family HTH domain
VFYVTKQETGMKTDRSNLRKRAGTSLIQLSRACGVSVSRLSLYERGECRLPDHELATIAAVPRESLDDPPAFTTDEQLIQYLEQEKQA